MLKYNDLTVSLFFFDVLMSPRNFLRTFNKHYRIRFVKNLSEIQKYNNEKLKELENGSKLTFVIYRKGIVF